MTAFANLEDAQCFWMLAIGVALWMFILWRSRRDV
jgi:hypothetical protein